jgi:hypothetical protein
MISSNATTTSVRTRRSTCALRQKCYVPSTRPYTGLLELDYPFHDKTVTVTTCGRICFNRQKINLSTVFAGQKVGIKQVSEEIWLVSFMDYDLGYFDHETCRLEPLANPFIRSRTDATSACISRSRRRPLGRQALIACSSRQNSMTSSANSTANAHSKRWT